MKIDLKLYRGYTNGRELEVFGHVFKNNAPDNIDFDGNKRKFAVAVIRMFRVKPLSNATVRLQFKNLDITTRTMEDGYFRFTVPFNTSLESGWHTYTVRCTYNNKEFSAKGEILKPFASQYGIISDIDDTFLISHSSSFFKKIYVLLTRNVHKRKIFDDVVEHYRALSIAGQDSKEASNSFFYVSSSEWNLYEFIIRFTKLHKLPKAVIKLKKLKTGLRDFIKTGRGDHSHKFVKIKDIISFYPNLRYVLLGDDSQQDAHIYERVCKTFPTNIKAVYIRQTEKKQKPPIQKTLNTIDKLGVDTYYFADSSKAMQHSKKIGIIN